MANDENNWFSVTSARWRHQMLLTRSRRMVSVAPIQYIVRETTDACYSAILGRINRFFL